MFGANENDALSQVNPDGLMGVDYVSLIAPLVKAGQHGHHGKRARYRG